MFPVWSEYHTDLMTRFSIYTLHVSLGLNYIDDTATMQVTLPLQHLLFNLVFSYTCQESNPGRPARSPSLYQLTSPGFRGRIIMMDPRWTVHLETLVVQ
jgi:hypothetical protein